MWFCFLFLLDYLTTKGKEIPQIVLDQPSQIYWPFALSSFGASTLRLWMEGDIELGA